MIKVDVHGAEELSRKVVRLGDRLDAEIKAKLLEAALLVEREAKTKGVEKGGKISAGAPRPKWPHVYSRTGRLRNSINHRIAKVGERYLAYVGTDVKYGLHLEEGTEDITARHWLDRSLQSKVAEIDKIMQDTVPAARRKEDI